MRRNASMEIPTAIADQPAFRQNRQRDSRRLLRNTAKVLTLLANRTHHIEMLPLVHVASHSISLIRNTKTGLIRKTIIHRMSTYKLGRMARSNSFPQTGDLLWSYNHPPSQSSIV